jgi:hypothetical protein
MRHDRNTVNVAGRFCSARFRARKSESFGRYGIGFGV